MWQSLHDAWWRLATHQHPQSFPEILASCALQAGSWPYGAAVAFRNLAYDRRWFRQASLPCKVVSIGNLTLGGTGKTACAILIARKLLQRGRRVAVLSRGYGGRSGPYCLQSAAGTLQVDGQPVASPAAGGAGEFDDVADEPQLLALALEGTPVLVDPRRDRSGAAACERFGADVAVLDDGFQHRRLRRDCDIVLVQARTPLGGWPLLPRGPMREPLESLRRADVIIITKADEQLETLAVIRERLQAINRGADVVAAAHVPEALRDPWTGASEPAAKLQGKRVGLVSSIGDPEGFAATVRRLDAQVAWHQAFPDHHRFAAADWERVRQAARSDLIVTTEKDWVRLRGVAAPPGVGEPPVRILSVAMKILSGEEALDARLAGL